MQFLCHVANVSLVMWCSLCPTFAAVACFIDNARWDGVPFLLKAGKALHSKRAEIRVQFRHVPGNLYKNRLGLDLDQTTNELVSWCFSVNLPVSAHMLYMAQFTCGGDVTNLLRG